MKILIVTDAWYPQVNGVVRTLVETGKQLELKGHEVMYLTPEKFKTFPLPSYDEIKMSWNVWKAPAMIKAFKPDLVHIATEGTLGVTARLYCSIRNIPHTTSYHTKTPEYVHIRYPLIPESLVYCGLRWLHKKSKAVLVTTESMKAELSSHGFQNLVVWSRGVDHATFNPQRRTNVGKAAKKLVYVGRVSIEKNIRAFLNLKIPNTVKYVVGDGPLLNILKKEYYTHLDVIFTGYKEGVELAKAMADADAFVFPSLTDTFGIVMIEAAACGTPIAAYPVTGPKDFVVNGVNGCIDEDLSVATIKALEVDRDGCHKHTVANYTWSHCANVFLRAATDK